MDHLISIDLYWGANLPNSICMFSESLRNTSTMNGSVSPEAPNTLGDSDESIHVIKRNYKSNS